jgi:hypothetical protein
VFVVVNMVFVVALVVRRMVNCVDRQSRAALEIGESRT